MTIDSGAEEVVAPKWFASDHPINQGSKTGSKYRPASGHKVQNEGERQVVLLTENGENKEM